MTWIMKNRKINKEEWESEWGNNSSIVRTVLVAALEQLIISFSSLVWGPIISAVFCTIWLKFSIKFVMSEANESFLLYRNCSIWARKPRSRDSHPGGFFDHFDLLRSIFLLKIVWDNLAMGMKSDSHTAFVRVVCICSLSPMCEAWKLDARQYPPPRTARMVQYPEQHPPISPLPLARAHKQKSKSLATKGN